MGYVNGNLNTAKYHEASETIRKAQGKIFSKMEMGLLGRCPRCATDGPCLESTCDSPGPDWDWSPGDTCSDRPFRDEETATAYLNNNYFSGGGGGLHRFWWNGEPRWIWKGTKYSDTGANSSIFGLMEQIGTMMKDFRANDKLHDGSHAQWAKEKLLEMLEKM